MTVAATITINLLSIITSLVLFIWPRLVACKNQQAWAGAEPSSAPGVQRKNGGCLMKPQQTRGPLKNKLTLYTP